MAILSNVNGKFAVDSTGAIQFSGQTGTSGYVLKSNGNAAPTWVDGSTVIGGPYLPLAGGILTGATSTASGISFTVGGTLTGTTATFTKDQNTDTTIKLYNPNTGTSAGANMYITNTSANADGLFLGAVGVNAGSGGFIADSGIVGSGTGASGGLVLMAREASSGIRFYTGGFSDLALTINSSQNATFSGNLNISSAGDLYINSGTSYNNKGSIFMSNQRTEIVSDIVNLTANGDTSLNFKTRSGGATASALFINEFRRIGIGTISPDVKLHVYNGDSGATTVGSASDELILENDNDCGLTIRSGTSSDGVISFADSGDHNIGQVYYSHSSNSMTFRTNDNIAVTIDNSQNVGIGTTSPQERLHVVGLDGSVPLSSYYGSLVVDNNGEAAMSIIGSSFSSIYFGDRDTNFAGAMLYQHSANAMIFKTNDNTEKMRIWSGGMIQIGDDSSVTPELLTLQAYTQNEAFSGKYSASGYLWFLRNETGPSGRFQLMNVGNTTINLEGNTTRDNYILGDLGIGTTTPGAKLEVTTSTAGFSSIIQNTNGASDANGLLIKAGTVSSEYSLKVSNSTDSTNFMVVKGNGNVGIGTTNPVSAKLVSSYDGTVNNGMAIINTNTGTLVQNLIIFKRNTTEVGAITSNNTTTTYVTSSDYRLKENVVEMTGALKRVSQLKPSRFNFIADADKTVDGFLAHEVQYIVPEAITGEKDGVDEKGNPKYQGIDQSKLVPLLVGAIQELKEEIEILKNK